MCKYYLRVQTCYPIAKHSNKGYSELMAYVSYLLAMLVYHDLPNVTNNPETVPAGPTQIAQQKHAVKEEEKRKPSKSITIK